MIADAEKERVVFNLLRGEDEKSFGTDYEKPHGVARFLSWIYTVIPKIGPFRILTFSVPTPEAERLFLDSFTSTRQHFKQSLDALKAERLTLANTDFDTGKETTRGEYSMADETYDELLGKLADHQFAGVSALLRSNLVDYYGDVDALPTGTDVQRKHAEKIRKSLALLAAVAVPLSAQETIEEGAKATKDAALVAEHTKTASAQRAR